MPMREPPVHPAPTIPLRLANGSEVDIVDLKEVLGKRRSPLPYCLRVVLENVMRRTGAGPSGLAEELAGWSPQSGALSVPLDVSRVVLPDSSGLPALMDLAAARDAARDAGLDPRTLEPDRTVDLIVDHSLIVDRHGTPDAFDHNIDCEFGRNAERYAFFKWAQQAFARLRVVPPGMGIIHQIHLERLARVVDTIEGPQGRRLAMPEFVLGCDSHTTMVNALGLLAWGVGGIEAEAALLGEPYMAQVSRVVGVRLTNRLRLGVTATDLVLTLTERLRGVGVTDAFLEFHGGGLESLSVPDRATIANMAPEYGATLSYFPIDQRTIDYLAETARPPEHIDLVERYARANGLFSDPAQPVPEYSEIVEVDLGEIEPSIAGPKRPQDRVPLRAAAASFRAALKEPTSRHGFGLSSDALETSATVSSGGSERRISHGALVIAAITSCTNTSNPSLMIGAGLLARNAVARGLATMPGVKTSLAPGSRLVRDYLGRAGLMEPLEALGFHVVGFACTTCSGKSGPIPPEMAKAIADHGLVAAAVLSGNRNFEGRIHPSAAASYLASPPLVVAYAIAGRIDIDFETEPLGTDPDGNAIFLRDIWPDDAEVADHVATIHTPAQVENSYSTLRRGTRRWQELPAPSGPLFEWDPASEYIKRPPFFDDDSQPLGDAIHGARALCVLGDSTTTDHITPSGNIPPESEAGAYLVRQGVKPEDFNAVTQRRGNHAFMARVTFCNPRLKNLLSGGIEGGWTRMAEDGEPIPVYQAAEAYRAEGTPLIVLAGRDYGMGSSRDWAAKGPKLLGVRAVIAGSFERIHRANLIGVGILPLTTAEGATAGSLGLTGFERFDILGLKAGLTDGSAINVVATTPSGDKIRFTVHADLASPYERDLILGGGLFPRVLRSITARASDRSGANQ